MALRIRAVIPWTMQRNHEADLGQSFDPAEDQHRSRDVRRYRRHLAKLRAAVNRSKNKHADWRRDILDDVGESLDEAA